MELGHRLCGRSAGILCIRFSHLSDGGADGEEPEVQVDGGVLHDEAHEGGELPGVHERDEGEDGGEGVQVEHHDDGGDLFGVGGLVDDDLCGGCAFSLCGMV